MSLPSTAAPGAEAGPEPTADVASAPVTQPPIAQPPTAGRGAQLAGGIVALLLLAAGLWFVYGPRTQGAPQGADTLAAANPAFAYVSDLDFWQRTPRESTVLATAHFDLDHALADVPLQVGTWSGTVVPETNEEVMILLEPEQYEQRLYRDADGFPMWLSMVGGRSSQPFHAPDICYDADGWQYSLGSYAVPLDDGGEVWGLYLSADKEKPDPDNPGQTTRAEHVVFYFYLFPDGERALDDGIVLFKLTSSRTGTVEETLARHADFVRQFFTQAAAGAPALPIEKREARSEKGDRGSRIEDRGAG